MSNFGAFDLRLVGPYDVAWREARSAVGASAVLERGQVFETLEEAIGDRTLVVGTASVGSRQARHTVERLEQGARLIEQAERPAILFGSEKSGLSNDAMTHCHWLMRIPTRYEHESMNLGQAVAVCLYELARVDAPVAAARTGDAAAGQLDRLEAVSMDVLTESGYFEGQKGASGREKVRRLLRRARFEASDVDLWVGMFRQILWRIRHPEG